MWQRLSYLRHAASMVSIVMESSVNVAQSVMFSVVAEIQIYQVLMP